MAQEEGIAKVDLNYILKAVMMGSDLYSNDWEKGLLYLTNINLWFSRGEGWVTIPLKNITMIGREVTGTVRLKAERATRTSHVLIIDYIHPSSVSQTATAASVALLTGPEPVINTLKTYMQPLCGLAPKKRSLSEIDKKLLYMFYTGITELQKATFLIGIDIDTLTESFNNLKEQELCDASGSLTKKGLLKIKEMI